MNKVSQIEVLKPIMVNGLALSLFADFGEKRVREEAVSPHWGQRGSYLVSTL